MAIRADHQGLPPSGRHGPFPIRLWWPSRPVDVRQLADVVNPDWFTFDPAQLASSGKQPLDDLRSRVGLLVPCRSDVEVHHRHAALLIDVQECIGVLPYAYLCL
jgi:hypothetical protein